MNCEQITLGQIALSLAFISGLIAACGTIYHFIKKALNKLFEGQIKAFDERMDTLENRIDRVDLESCKNYLVNFLSDVERGKNLDEIELERFCEEYEHYIKAGGNSYIKHKVEKLKAEGKL